MNNQCRGLSRRVVISFLVSTIARQFRQHVMRALVAITAVATSILLDFQKYPI